MKGRQVVLGHVNGTKVAALMQNGILHDVFIEHANQQPLGTIVRAVVDRPMKGIGGAMLRMPGGQGFVKKTKGLSPGDAIVVQTSGFAEDGKAAPVTQRVLHKSRYAIVTPDAPGLNISRSIRSDQVRDELAMIAKAAMEGSDMGLIIRSIAEVADAEDVLEDITTMRDTAEAIGADLGTKPEVLMDGPDPHALAWREWSDVQDVLTGQGDLEGSGALDQLEAAQDAFTPFNAGGMYVEATRAMVTVDVNTGTDMSPAAALKANMAAVKDLPRQLRLRGFGGQVAVDFAPLSKRDRKPIEVALKAAFRNCPVSTDFVGWTPLGHAEMQRKCERLWVGKLFV